MACPLLGRAVLSAALATATLKVSAAPGDLPALIAQAKPSVVAVGSYSPTDSPRFGFRGSGFVVGPNLLITNAHVLPDRTTDQRALAIVTRSDAANNAAEPRAATVVAVDPAHDLALLRFDGPALPALPMAQPQEVREGLAVVFIGYPIGGLLGFTPVTHRGIVSSITAIALPAASVRGLNTQAIRQIRQGPFDIYQLDATAYPGNSGGPLIDAQTGRVVGVINMVLIKGSKESALTHPSGISYAIPVQFVSALLADPAVSGDARPPSN